MSTILLPMKPEYVKSIFNGSKKIVYRKQIPKYSITRIVVYSTSPLKAVIGEVEVQKTMTMECSLLWECTKNETEISKKQFDNYFKNYNIASAYKLGKYKQYNSPNSLLSFGINNTPHSFVYLRECPYCKNVILFDKDSSNESNSKSEEHIIPFSLGNEEIVIPKGIICDRCNNYFAREIEKPFLNNKTIKQMRSYHRIPSRKNKIPATRVNINGEYARMVFNYKNNYAIINFDDLSNETISEFISNPPPFLSFDVNIDDLKDKYYVSRLLIKIFTEINLYYSIELMKPKENNWFLVFDKKMEELYNYVRFGDRKKKLYDYKVELRKEVVLSANDDFIASIRLLLDDSKKELVGMVLDLYELRFTLFI